MHVGAITFHDIGAIVLDFESPEFKCLQMDGILGANQMAKLFFGASTTARGQQKPLKHELALCPIDTNMSSPSQQRTPKLRL